MGKGPGGREILVRGSVMWELRGCALNGVEWALREENLGAHERFARCALCALYALHVHIGHNVHSVSAEHRGVSK